jgi:hypothetical protein
MTERSRTPLGRDVVFVAFCVGVAGYLLFALGHRTEPIAPLAFFGRLHPLVVHLPIGMLLLVGALEALSFFPSLRARIDPAMAIVLRLALVSSVVAFALGLLLATEGGYAGGLLRMHRRLTSVVVLWSGASVIVWSSALPRALHRICLGVTLLALSIGAHYGGSMTHGEGYLVEKAPAFARKLFGAQKDQAKSEPLVAAPGGSLVFDDLVLPVFRDKCVGCHGASSVKGKLRLDTFDAVMKGGAGGPIVVPRASRESPVVERIASAVDAEGHMPPKSKPQLTSEEVELVRWWIDRMASPAPAPDAGAPLADAGAEIADAGAPDAAPPVADAGLPAPATSSTTTAKKKPTGDRYTTVVQPILAKRCGSCHGGARPASKLVITDRAALLKKVVVPGSPSESSLVTRMTLPLDDDDHMPPSNKPQPSASEIATIKSWIASGAPGPESAAPGGLELKQ